ncbi:MAG: hypothetical protein INF43_01495 [Alphaproteobacteria bacterium]|nr:hypothetical protein [Alphaproteobacteria bacterium]
MAYKFGSLASTLSTLTASAEHRERVAARQRLNGQKPFTNDYYLNGVDSPQGGRKEGERMMAQLLRETEPATK